MNKQEQAEAAFVNIITNIKLGDTMRVAHAKVAADLAPEVSHALNAILHGKRAEYRALLARHDWDFQYCDDHEKWKRLNALHVDLDALQVLVDPTADLWNAAAPVNYRKTVTL